MRRRNELPQGACLGDDRCHLPAGHGQEPGVFRAEDPRLDGLHDEDALQETALDDRDAEERAIQIFARLGKVLEARMAGCVGDDLRPHLFGHEPRQSFVQPHAHAADAFGFETDRGGEHQVRAIGFQ